jgi:hypothetical protein
MFLNQTQLSANLPRFRGSDLDKRNWNNGLSILKIVQSCVGEESCLEPIENFLFWKAWDILRVEETP